MKRPLICSILLVGLLGLASCGNKDIEKTGLVKLSNQVYAMIASGPAPAEGFGANSGFVVGSRGVLVIDTRYTPALANDLLKAIRSVTSAPIKYVVNTHYHPDHTWGNSVFKEQGAIIIARPETREALLKYSPVYLDLYREAGASSFDMLKDVKVVAPDTTVGSDTTIDLGGVNVVLRYFGPAHTAGDCVVVIPKEKIAFAGGLLSNGYHPNMGDPAANFDNWILALDRLGGADVKYIVPGQGAICGKKALKTEKMYIQTLLKVCSEDIKKLMSVEQAVASIKIPGAESYLQPNVFSFNVQAVYRCEIPAVVRPDFAFDAPEGFQIVDGGGSAKLGVIRWGAQSKDGILEIEVQWKPASNREVIYQDVTEQVARLMAIGGRILVTEGSKRIDIGGEKEPAAYGEWKYKKELGMLGGGIWTVAMAVRGDRIYTIQLSTDAGYDRQIETKNMSFLEKVISTFRVIQR